MLSLGPIQVRWYGMMYLVGFTIAGFLMKRLVKEGLFKVKADETDQLVTYSLFGLFLGARLLYVFVYNWDYYSLHLSEIFHVWKGGLSFHGGVLGLIVGGYFFKKKHRLSTFHVFDVIALAGSQGVFWGRMGNFINGELYGRRASESLPWAMIFPSGGHFPRHPSQLYEGILEGIVTFLILWFARKHVKIQGHIAALYLFCYGVFRFTIEFFREPDSQLGYYFNYFTMGQFLCSLMIVASFIVFMIATKINEPFPKSKI